MGFNIHQLGEEFEQLYRDTFDKVCEISFYRATRPYIKNWMMKYLEIGKIQDEAVKIGHDLTDKIIKERLEYHERTNYKTFQNYSGDVNDTLTFAKINGKRKRLAVIDLLLLAHRDGLIDYEGITEEVDTFILAGYEAMGMTIAYSLLLLAENKEAQDQVRAEIFDIMNENESKITIGDLKKMVFLDRCIKETLRLFPGVPQIARCITEEIQLKNYRIPVNTEVIMSFYDLHRDPNFWPDPNKFDPDRFLPENSQDRHSHAYLPFSSGPRNCIGLKFAMQELKLLVAYILHNFYLEPIDTTADLKLEMNVILKPTHPIRAKFVKINR